MPLQVIDNGENNFINLPDSSTQNLSGTVTFHGSNIEVTFGENVSGMQVRMNLHEGSSLKIGDGCKLAAIDIEASPGSEVIFGSNVAFVWHARIFAREGQNISIGNTCLIAAGATFLTSDMHSVIDINSGHRINPGAPIRIADKVWFGENVSVLKGVTIGTDSIIGLGSVVASDIPANSAAAGVPARVVRTDVTWTHALVPMADPEANEMVKDAPVRGGRFARLLRSMFSSSRHPSKARN